MNYERPIVLTSGNVRTILDLLSATKDQLPISHDWRVEKLRNFVDSNPTRIGKNLGQVCVHLGLGMSERQARRLFKEYTKMGIKEYARKKRLDTAAHQLRTTDVPIKVIAVEAGYRHVSTFTKYFLKYSHLSPMDFRKIWRASDTNH